MQGYNDPVKSRFATVARRAAAHHPDLVIHVGDYHYHETPQANHSGCADSPFGDNSAVWRRDFVNSAAPLLAVAPWVMVRGSHELSARSGHPHPTTINCRATTPPYLLHIDGLTLQMLDGTDADDDRACPAKVAINRPQTQSLLTDVPRHAAWLLTHWPIWALAQSRGVPKAQRRMPPRRLRPRR